MVQGVPVGNAETSLSPVKRIRQLLGTARVATLCGRTSEAVRKWGKPVSKGGRGGVVPAEFLARILAEARAQGKELTAEDLIAEPTP